MNFSNEPSVLTVFFEHTSCKLITMIKLEWAGLYCLYKDHGLRGCHWDGGVTRLLDTKLKDMERGFPRDMKIAADQLWFPPFGSKVVQM